jgi:hypothetical protein
MSKKVNTHKRLSVSHTKVLNVGWTKAPSISSCDKVAAAALGFRKSAISLGFSSGLVRIMDMKTDF